MLVTTNLPISVIIPSYNRAAFLPRAVTSVLNQSGKCSEIIIVDDGSDDNTRVIVEGMKATANRIRYIYQENKGPASARNTGITKSSYPFLAFLDSDDHWHRKKLETQYGALSRRPEYLISHTREKWLRRGEHLNQKKKHIPRHGDIFSHCLELCGVGMSTVMARKELFEENGLFDTSLRCCEDYDYWLRISCRHRFLLIDEPLTVKEGGRDDQVSFQYRVGMDKLRITAIHNLLEDGCLNTTQRHLARMELIKKAEIYGKGCLRHNKKEEAEYYLGLARRFVEEKDEKR